MGRLDWLVTFVVALFVTLGRAGAYAQPRDADAELISKPGLTLAGLGLEAIQPTLRGMREAVLTGNPEAYLAHVATSDPVFVVEQRAWAADLVELAPVRFDLEFTDRALDVAGRATGELRMSWQMPEGPERWVEFEAVFERAPADHALAPAWLYAGRVWEERVGEGVVVLCEPHLTEVAERIAQVYPEVRKHVETGFELPIPSPQTVKLYGNMSRLQASIYLSYSDSLGGWNEPGESIKLLASRGMSRGQIEPLLAHELAHVATFVMGPRAVEMPWWAAEGVAELASERFKTRLAWERVERSARDWAQAESLVEWKRMADFRETPAGLYPWVYAQGHHMVSYISSRFGRSDRNAWLRAMAQGRSLEAATREALGLDFETLDGDWRASLVDERVGAGRSDEER